MELELKSVKIIFRNEGTWPKRFPAEYSDKSVWICSIVGSTFPQFRPLMLLSRYDIDVEVETTQTIHITNVQIIQSDVSIVEG